MKKSLALALLATAAVLPGAANATLIPAGTIRPMFTVGSLHLQPALKGKKTKTLAQWPGSFTDLKGNTIKYVMVGSDPNTTNTTTTVKVLIIPIKMVYGSTNGNMTFDPNKMKTTNGSNTTVTKDIAQSPLFASTVDFVENGTDLGGGKTQYEDAFQRGNFWGAVSTNSSYHLLYKAKVMPEQTIDVKTSQEGTVITNPFGKLPVGTASYSWFQGQLASIIKSVKAINPSVVPLFVTGDIFLTSGGCCIGGYHDAIGTQTYSYSTYETEAKSFSQDVSALSHEMGEWTDDPFIDNRVDCEDNGILEVGDPLEGGPNYGAYPYTVGSATYNLQSLVYLGYFGAPRTTSFDSWLAFQNDENNVCPGQ